MIMNTFVKKLIEFADYCGNIENVTTYAKRFSTVEGKLRDGKHSFSIHIRFEEIKEDETDGTENLE